MIFEGALHALKNNFSITIDMGIKYFLKNHLPKIGDRLNTGFLGKYFRKKP
jgi:hypothetical protein